MWLIMILGNWPALVIFQVSYNRVSEADPMRPTVVVTVYPLLITVKSKPGYSGAPEKNRTPDIHITSFCMFIVISTFI